MTLSKQYKIQKKVRQHHRRLKKEAKKLKALGIYQTKSKKENPLPNLYPYKKKLIEAMERRKKTAQTVNTIQKLKEKEEQPIIDEETLQNNMNKTVIYEEEVKRIEMRQICSIIDKIKGSRKN